jgi:hypothetical protein
MIINIVGFILLWAASDIGRGPESKIRMFSPNWWIILVLITAGVLMGGYTELSV